MARIDLKECDIFIEDGLSGTGRANDLSISMGDTTLSVAGVVLNTDDTDQIPVGTRFTAAGETGATVHTVTARTPTSGATTSITFSPALGTGIAPAENEVQEIAVYSGTVSGGNFTLTIDLANEAPFTTANIAHDADASTIESAIDTAATMAGVVGWTNGDISVSGGPLTTDPVVLTFDGASVAQLNHALTTINDVDLSGGGSPGAVSTTNDGVVGPTLTFTNQRLEIKVGDGDLTYSEKYEYNYDLDRGELDTVRRGDEQPMDVNLNFTFEHITTGTGESIAPADAVRRRGGAAEWVSTSADLCEPFSVDLRVVRTPECGTADPDVWVFPDFRVESIEPSFRDATIAISGRCNAEEPITSRSVS